MPMAVGARVGLSPIARAQIYVRYLNCGFRHAFLIENLSMPCIVCGGTGGCPYPPPSAWIHAAHLKHGFRHAFLIENVQFPLYFGLWWRNVQKVGLTRIEAPLYRNGRRKKNHM